MWGLAVVIALYFYIRFAIWIARKLAGKRESKRWKWGVRSAVALMLILVPTVDSILGHLYFNHLCSTEAGVKVYQTVELPAEYWDGQGKPKFSVNGGADNRQTVFAMDGKTWEGKRFLYSSFTERYNQSLHVEKAGFRLSDRETGRVFGEVLYFRYWGGWLARNFSPHNSAASCEIKNLDGWEYNIFKPATSTR